MFYLANRIRKEMKKLISIALVLSIIAPFWISYSVIQFQKYSVKKEIKKQIINGLDINDLVLLKFSNEETKSKLKWEHGKEFEYNDVMYDIVKTETKNDSVYYWCWEDTEETELNIKLNNLVEKAAGSDKSSKENLKRLSNFFSSLYFSYKNPFDLDRNKNSSEFSSRYLNYYSSQTPAPLTPPPKTSFC